MKHIIQDPEETERQLLDAGFCVGVRDGKFVVSLSNRTVTRLEVAVVLVCEAADLSPSHDSVLVS